MILTISTLCGEPGAQYACSSNKNCAKVSPTAATSKALIAESCLLIFVLVKGDRTDPRAAADLADADTNEVDLL